MPSSEPTQPHFENQRHKGILKRFFVTDTALNFSCFSGTGSTQNIITALLQLLIVADRNRGAAVDFVSRLPETDVCWLFVKKKKKKEVGQRSDLVALLINTVQERYKEAFILHFKVTIISKLFGILEWKIEIIII